MSPIFSGEPLPIAPHVQNPELENFHRKLLDYLRRLTQKMENSDYFGGGDTIIGGSTESLAMFSSVPLPISPYPTWSNIAFNKKIHVNPLYEVVGHRISVKEPGLFALHVTLETDTTDGTLPLNYFRAGYEGPGALPYGMNAYYGKVMVYTVPIPLTPDYPLIIQASTTASFAIHAIATRSRFLLFRLSKDPFAGGNFDDLDAFLTVPNLDILASAFPQ